MQVRIINKWVYDEAQTSCVTRVHDFLIQICAPAYCIIRWVFGCICQSLPPSLSLSLSWSNCVHLPVALFVGCLVVSVILLFYFCLALTLQFVVQRVIDILNETQSLQVR